MRFLVRLSPQDVPREKLLSSVKTVGRPLGADIRNPKWTSYGALEIDVFSPTRPDFELFLSALSPLYPTEFSRDLNVAPPHHSDGEIIAEARDYFNSERYWECHETLEGLWRLKDREEKSFLQGLILLCAAYVHHQKGEESVALGVLGRALAKLDFTMKSYHSLDPEMIKHRTAAMLEERRFAGFRI